MTNSPVLFLIFNRPDLTEKVFSAIREAKPSQLFIAADGPRADKPGEKEKCELTRNLVLNGVDWDCEVHTLLRDTNMGCKLAVSSAIDWFFENVEEGIILEDDILPDQSFFKYCEEMLVRYKDNDQITQISGVNLMGEWNKNDESYFFSKAGGIWGWATWRRAWKHYDVEIKSWNNRTVRNGIKKFLDERKWFDLISDDFDKVYNGQCDTWDFQWVYTQMKIHGFSVIPSKNLIRNIGFRDDATHTKNANESIESKMKAQTLIFPLNHPDKIISNYTYTSYYFNLLIRKPEPSVDLIIKKIKSRIKNVFKKTN